MWLSLGAFALGCFFCGFLPELSEPTVSQLAPPLIGLLILLCAALALTKKLTADRAVWLLFAVGFTLRILYVLYTPYTARQHDVWLVTSGKGHMGYIQYIAEHLAIPDTNRVWQFTHPPLHHILAGVLYRLLFNSGLAPEIIAEKLQFLTCFYSCAMMTVCDRLFCRCGLKNGARVLANTVIVFHPTFLLLGGCLNNDMLCLLLSVASLLYFAAWWQEKTTAPLALCGVFLGLAMMAKVSAALLAFPLAAAFVARAFSSKEKPARLLKQYALFGALSVPLGMWFPVRNLLRFGQSFGYVAALSPEANASQYLAGISPARRLLSFPLSQLQNPFQSWDETDPGCNIFLSLFKTSVFGEGEWGSGMFAPLLLYVSILLALTAFAVLLWRSTAALPPRSENGLDAVWLILSVVTLLSFILFCFSYPFICSQDFRYLAALLPFGALSLGNLFTSSKSRVLRGLLGAGIGLFALSSTVIYALPHYF